MSLLINISEINIGNFNYKSIDEYYFNNSKTLRVEFNKDDSFADIKNTSIEFMNIVKNLNVNDKEFSFITPRKNRSWISDQSTCIKNTYGYFTESYGSNSKSKKQSYTDKKFDEFEENYISEIKRNLNANERTILLHY